MTIPREARSEAMRLAGDLVFSASGRRALTELGLMGSSEVTDAALGDPSMGVIVEYLNARVEDADIPRLGRVHGRSHAAELLAG